MGSEASSADVEVRPPRPPWPPTMRPSKFRKGEMYHSDYESDWDASPIPPKWRPCHSDTEDLVGASKYRSVKPKLKQGRQRSNEKRPPSPPCPHQWESHEDIENLEKSLREGRNLVRPPTKDPLKLPRRCHSTPVGITTSTVTKTSSEHVIVKKEFVSVKRRAQLLEDMLSAQPQSGDESSERATPIKPEALAGAVRVLPPTTSSPLSFGRSASVDMTANGISPMMMAFGPYSTLPAKPFRSESCHVNRDERQSNLATTTLSRKFQVAITSSEDKSISKSEADSPPTIQLTAFKNDQLFKPSKFVPFGDTEGMIWKPTTPLHRA